MFFIQSKEILITTPTPSAIQALVDSLVDLAADPPAHCLEDQCLEVAVTLVSMVAILLQVLAAEENLAFLMEDQQ